MQITDGKHGDCENQENSGYYFVSVKDIDDDEINYSNARQITKFDFEDTDRRTKLENEDILITNSGTIGKFVFVNSPLSRKTTFQKSVAIIKPNKNKIIPKFLYYYLISEKRQLVEYAGGTTQKNLLLRDIRNFEVKIPDESRQKKIIMILNDIDQLISVNKKLNKNLEQLSQNLFRKWFINFDLKNDFNLSEPLKESSLGKIPKSWEIETIGDLSIVKGRIGWRGYTTNDLVDEGPWVVGGKEITSGFIDFNTAKHLTREKYEESPEIMLKDKDLVIAKTGTIGPIAMFYENYGEATLNPNVCLIRSKNITPALLLTFFKTARAQYYLNEFTTSSVQPAINQTTIKQLEIALPSDKQLLNKLGDKFEEINLLQFNLNEEIKKLQKLRDTLLPKLMSGEIDVSKINCDLE